jgi:lipopolysaccharide biosynthesis regulator YciM
MFRASEVATALTGAWVRNGTPKTPKEIADFYCALYDALEQSQNQNVSKEEAQGKASKADSRFRVVQLACAGLLMLLAAIGIFAVMSVK